MSERRSIPLDAVTVVDRHRQTLGDLKDLTKSMDRLGLLHPIVVTPDMRLIAGQRRLEAARELGWKAIQAHVIDNLDSARTLLEAERDENTCRKDMNPSEKVALGLALEELERPSAAERKGQRTDLQPKEKFSSGSRGERTGKVYDLVGEAVGMSGVTYKRAKAVVKAAGEGDPVAQAAVKEMDASGKVVPAYNKVTNKVTGNGRPRTSVEDQVRTGRGQQIAMANKRRVETLVGTCQGLKRGLPDLRVEHAVHAATPEEVAGWVACIKDAEKALREFRGRIRVEEKTHA